MFGGLGALGPWGLGGSGTRAIAAALALAGRSMMSALMGTTAPADCPVEILPKLTLTTELSAAALMEAIDGRTLINPTSVSMGSFWCRKQAGPSGSVKWRT